MKHRLGKEEPPSAEPVLRWRLVEAEDTIKLTCVVGRKKFMAEDSSHIVAVMFTQGDFAVSVKALNAIGMNLNVLKEE